MVLPDYFALFNLPQTFHPDAGEVRKKYYQLSRQYHPDRAVGEGSSEALRMSALVNEAYKTLSDPDLTMGYLLKLHSVVEDEEHYQLPAEFLMNMMELNESVDEGGEAAFKSWQSAVTTWEEETVPLINSFEKGERTATLLIALKVSYYQKKYLMRIKQRLD